MLSNDIPCYRETVQESKSNDIGKLDYLKKLPQQLSLQQLPAPWSASSRQREGQTLHQQEASQKAQMVVSSVWQ